MQGRDVDDAVRQLARSQGGVVTRAQARAAGVPVTQLRGTGPLVRVRPGVYAERLLVADLDDRGRTALAVTAARLVSDVDLVACRLTAAVLHGLPLLVPAPTDPQLLERREERPRHHGQGTKLPPGDVTELAGVPVTGLARTSVDVARRHGWLCGVVVADAALARGVHPQALQDVLRRCDGWPGARHGVRALALADGRAESPLESLGRIRMGEQRLPDPEAQVWLGDGDDVIARVDHYWAAYRTVAEADGALKYAEPGALFAEKLREDRLREAGFEVVRYSWADAMHRPVALAARVRRAFARSQALRRTG